MVAGDEGSLGGCHGEEVVAFGEESVDPERSGDADGDFDGANEVFDVAGVGGEFGGRGFAEERFFDCRIGIETLPEGVGPVRAWSWR